MAHRNPFSALTRLSSLAPLAALASLSACAVASPSDEPVGETSSAILTVPIGPVPINLIPWPVQNTTSTFKLLVITPRAFVSTLAPLVAHKNAIGVTTAVAAMEDVQAYGAALGVKDDAVAIKTLIRTVFEGYGTKYVMLAGDASLIPARHTTVLGTDPSDLPGAWALKYFFPTDLYYENLYASHSATSPVGSHGGFSTWDANGNGFYDEAYGPAPATAQDAAHFNPDDVDGFPDIAVGRVEALTTGDLATYIAKVIAYENGGSITSTMGMTAAVADFNYAAEGTETFADGLSPTGGYGAGLSYTINAPAGAQEASGWKSEPLSAIPGLFASARWINYVGHGDWLGWDGWGSYDVSALPNVQNWPVVFSSGCESGEFAQNVPLDASTYLGQDGALHLVALCSGSASVYCDYGDGSTSKVLGAQFTPVEPSIYAGSGIFEWSSTEGDRPTPPALLFSSPGAGAIAYVGSTQTTQANVIGQVATAMMSAAYAYPTGVALGDAYLAGMQSYWAANVTQGGYFTAPRLFLNYMELSGDPSLQLRLYQNLRAPIPLPIPIPTPIIIEE